MASRKKQVRRRAPPRSNSELPAAEAPFRASSEEDERRFWAEHDSTEFIDWQSAQRRRFPNLKPSRRTISLRLIVSMIDPR
ncbi:MAG: CopG family antitoxin [Bryobacteraceae bacterium]